MKSNISFCSRLRRFGSFTMIAFGVSITGCYHASTPRAACLDPLASWQQNAGPHPSQMYAAPQTQEMPYMPGQDPSMSPVMTMPSSDLPSGVAPVSANMPIDPSTMASFDGACAPGQCAPGQCANGACTSGNCPTASCPSCAPACSSWTPNCLPQYCVNPQEYLCDGGDKPPSVKVSVNGEPLNLGAQDTVVTYEDRNGSPEVAASNCVCVYAPRFAAVRKVSTAAAGGRAIAAVGFDVPASATPMEGRIPGVVVSDIQGPLRERFVRGPDAYKERNRAVPVMGEQRLLQARDVLEVFAGISVLETGALIDADRAILKSSSLAAVIWTGRDVVDVIIDEQRAVEAIKDRAAEELKVYEVQGHGKVRICKVADRGAAQVGDTVTFVLRVDNVGDAPVKTIVVSDNLTTRLEYIEGTQACTKGAIFKAKPNESGSVTVSWELTDDMKVGEGCIIRFRCKVR